MVLRRFAEGAELVTAQRDKDAARRLSKRTYCLANIAYLDPAIACNRDPWRPAQRDQRHAALPCRGCGVGRDDRGVGMRGIDQHVDALARQIVRKPRDAAEAADAQRHRLLGRRRRAAGKRQRDVEIGMASEAPGQLSRFRRAAENEDSCHADC